MKMKLTIGLTILALLMGWQMLPEKEEDLGVGAVKTVAGQTFALAGSGISSSATSFTLTSFTIPQNGQKINDAAISDTFYMTLEPGSRSRQEIISCTTVVQNAAGTATISGCTRGLSPLSPYTASSSLQFAHSGGSQVVLSDPPQLFEQYGALENDAVITGAWTAITPVAALGIATKAYVDSVVNGGALTLDGIAMGATAGETFATGTIVYYDINNTEWMKASAATAASSTGVILGQAQGAGTNGAAIVGGVLTRGYSSLGSGMTPGQTLYLSDTAGATSTSEGTVPVTLGIVRSASVLYFEPNIGYPTLAGDNIFSGSNSFTGAAPEIGIVNMTAGETINGGTLPVPIYASTTDSKVYAADGKATEKMKYIGFATSNGTDGSTILVQTRGIVDGFTVLEIGEKYYISDTAGSISTTTGTQEILAGIAVNTTELLIQKGRRHSNGAVTNPGTSSGTQVVTTGFRPSAVRLVGLAEGNTADELSGITVTWTNTATRNTSWASDSGTVFINGAARLYDGENSNYMTYSIINVTDTGFTINWTETGTFAPANTTLSWEAEGEL